jgi:hypothetical protein
MNLPAPSAELGLAHPDEEKLQNELSHPIVGQRLNNLVIRNSGPKPLLASPANSSRGRGFSLPSSCCASALRSQNL